MPASHAAFLDTLAAQFARQLPAEETTAFHQFIHAFFLLDTVHDLKPLPQTALQKTTLQFWQFLKANNDAVEVQNTESNLTVVQLVHRDLPFIVDSLRMMLNARQLTIHRLRHTVIHTPRDEKGKMCLNGGGTPHKETIVYLEVDRLDDPLQQQVLADEVRAVLMDVERVVDDYHPVTAQLHDFMQGVSDEETLAFLHWLLADHFTFLGCERITVGDNGARCVESSKRGLFRGNAEQWVIYSPIEADFMAQNEPLLFTKAADRSTVHRPAYPDVIRVRRFNEEGTICEELRVAGLFTSPVYRISPHKIPFIRNKVAALMQRSGLDLTSHHGKDLTQILEIFPRDELFQTPLDELYDTTMAILRIQERKLIRVFVRQDPYGPFCSALVFVPRDWYSTALRQRMEDILTQQLDAVDSEFTTYFSESTLCRVHYVFKMRQHQQYDLDTIRAAINTAATFWQDDLRAQVIQQFGRSHGHALLSRFSSGFTAAYQEAFSPTEALLDLQHIEPLDDAHPLSVNFYHDPEDPTDQVHLKLYLANQPLPLADQIPILENLGLRVLAERAYGIRDRERGKVWLYDYWLHHNQPDAASLNAAQQNFSAALEQIWQSRTESDSFNRLILGAGLRWHDVAILRAYARYMKQLGLGVSQHFIADTLTIHTEITRTLVQLIHYRFNPAEPLSLPQRHEQQAELTATLTAALDGVASLNEDRILSCYLNLIESTVRTNAFQLDKQGQYTRTLAFKVAARRINVMPKPAPLYEIFVYSPEMEGVHLRGGEVARGGLRWSDRLEDYRTEVLGLVKAQQVKNALIVPVGAKGGFVCKTPLSNDRETRQAQGISSYQQFITALLSVTDNQSDDGIIPPTQVVKHDGDDSYLVVAADKGTATFSDIANAISCERGFWLGDAFASGGSVGYDHKKMGITAKGAWVSVQRHFREMGIDVQTDRFTALGIGDMAGDVFGNGMLCSESMALVAAFNHQHIFIDPNPDVAAAYAERQRLFNLSRSSWADYNTALISKGGGVFERSAKSISLSAPIKALLQVEDDQLPPNALIKALLKAPVDLLWNGGIGTYVKAHSESHGDVGDKANDNLRVNGRELRVKVIGEGGNLGVSQLGRIEFAQHGGRLNTDFIDNSAGVDCSDREVNIKIALNALVKNRTLSEAERNSVLESMTDEVAQLVLQNNARQTQAISLVSGDATDHLDDYRRFMEYLEEKGSLDRAIEFLPDNDTLKERRAAGNGLTRPELSLLLSYSKHDLKAALLNSTQIDDDYFERALFSAFPPSLVEHYADALRQHPLRRQIIATQVANQLVDRMGMRFIHRLQLTTGASAAQIALAYCVSVAVFDADALWQDLEQLSDVQQQYSLMKQLIKLLRRTTRWFIRIERQDLSPTSSIAHYTETMVAYLNALNSQMGTAVEDELHSSVSHYRELGLNETTAHVLASLPYLLSAVPVISASDDSGCEIASVVKTFFAVGDQLGLSHYNEVLTNTIPTSHWQSQALDSAREELNWQQRTITMGLLKEAEGMSQWQDEHGELIARWQSLLSQIELSKVNDVSMFTVANRALMDLAQATVHGH